MISVIYTDDEPDLLEIGKLFLEREGHFSVDTATSAKEALEKIERNDYDAIISDYQMPGMDGIEFLKRVRASGSTLPFIIFTGRGREEIVIQALNGGADSYIQKGGEPLSQFAELAHKVRKAVHQRRTEASIRDHERREADIINFLPDATFAIDTKGVVIAWNRAMEKMTGVKAADILGKGNFEYALPFYHERRKILIDLVLADDPATESLYPYVTRTGNTLFSEITIPRMYSGKGAALWFTASPLYDNRGGIVGAIESIRDVTERKSAEAARSESERRLRELADLLPQAVYEADMDGTLTYANRIAFRMFGYTEDEIGRGLNVLDMVIQSDRERTREGIRRVLEGRTQPEQEGEFTGLKKDGCTFPIIIYSSPIVREGRVSGFRGIIVDISARKRIETELQNSVSFLNSLIDQSPMPMWISDENGVLTRINRACCELLHIEETDVVGTYSIFNDNLVRDQGFIPLVRDVFEKGIVARFQINYDTAQLDFLEPPRVTSLILDVTIFPVRDTSGRITNAVIQNHDITGQKRAGEYLQQSEVRFRSLIQNASDMIRIIGPDRRIVYESPSVESILGYPAGENLGKDPLAFIHPDDLERVRADLRQVFDRNNPGTPTEFRTLKADGTYIWVDTVATNLLDVPAINGIVVTTRPIEQRKMMEQAIRESEQKYRAVFETTGTAMVLIENDGLISLANSEAERLSGYTREEIENRMKITEFIVPEDRDRMLAQHRLRRQEPERALSQYEFRFRSRSGDIHDIYITIGLIPGTDKSVASLLDITERKFQEHILKNQLELGLLLQKIHGLKETLEACLAAAIRISGMDAGGIYLIDDGTGSFDLVAASNLSDGFIRNNAHFPAGSPYARRVIGGTPLYVAFSKTGIPHTTVLDRGGMRAAGMIPIISDDRVIGSLNITSGTHDEIPASARISLETIAAQIATAIERIRSEKALLESQQRNAAIIAALPDLLFIVSRDGTYLDFTAADKSLLSMSPDRIIGKNICSSGFDAETAKAILDAIAAAIDTGTLRQIEYDLVVPPGPRHFEARLVRLDAGRVLGIVRDITRQNDAETAIRESERKFSTIFSINPALMALSTMDEGRFIDVNETFCTMLGYTRDEVIGHTSAELDFFTRPEEREEMKRRVAQAGSVRNMPMDIRKKDGTVRRGFFSAEMLRIGSESLWLTIMLDATERLDAEEALLRSEDRLRFMVDHLPGTIWAVDRDLRFTVSRGGGLAALGIEPGQVVGMTLGDYFGTEDPDHPAIAAHRKALAGEPVAFEYTHNGTFYRTFLSPLFDEGGIITGVSGIAYDITANKQAEEALRESRDLLDATQRLAKVGGWVWDTVRQTMTWTGETYRIHGFGPGSIVAGSPEHIRRSLACYDPGDRPVIDAAFRSCAEEGIPYDLEFPLTREGGGRIWVRTMGRPVTEGGRIVRVVGNIMDITGRKEAEAAIRESEERFRAIFACQQNGIVIIDPVSHRILDANPKALDMIGSPSGDVIGTICHRFICPAGEGNCPITDLHQEVDASERVLVSCDGREIPVLKTVVRAVIGGKDVLIESFSDISDLKSREDRIRVLGGLLDLIPASVTVHDEKGTFLYANRKTFEYHGYTEEEFYRINLHELDVAESERRIDDRIRQLVETGETSFEVGHFRKDGSVLPLLVNARMTTWQGSPVILSVATDITERLMMEETLRASGQEFSTLANNSPDLIVRFDTGLRHRYGNPTAERETGFTTRETIGRRPSELPLPAHVAAAMETSLQSALATGVQETVELEFPTPLGPRTYETRIVPERNYAGTVVSLLAISRDITDRIAAEKAIKERETRYRSFVENSRGIAYRGGNDFRPEFIEGALEAITGYTRDEFMSGVVRWDQLIVPEDLPSALKLSGPGRDPGGAAGDVTYRITRRDGTIRWVRQIFHTVRDAAGTPAGSEGMIFDITAPKQLEQEIRRSREQLDLALWGADEGIIDWDLERGVLTVSERTATMLGYQPGKFPVDRDGFLALVHPDDRAEGDRQFAGLLAGSIPSFDYEERYKSASGEWIWILARGKVVARDAAGRPQRYIGTHRDISRRKQAEQAVLETTKKINLLASITRHDVANQVTLLKGYAQLARKKNPDPAVAGFLTKIETAGSAISRQIEFTRVYQELGMHAPEWQSVRDLVQRQNPEGISISCSCDGKVFADTMLEKVFFNLIDNARRHGEGVTEIQVRCRAANGEYIITVEDNGIGVPPSEKEKIFERGYGKHTGFGLFLAREILAITGITIRETGIYRHGARFELHVPAGHFRFHEDI